MIMYGIPNCDTIKKTKDWMNAKQIAFEFFDYKNEKITAAKLKNWVAQKGMETILNKKSSTWRELSEEQQQSISNNKAAIALMMEKPSIIKRPVIENDDEILAVGFNAAEYEKIFLSK